MIHYLDIYHKLARVGSRHPYRINNEELAATLVAQQRKHTLYVKTLKLTKCTDGSMRSIEMLINTEGWLHGAWAGHEEVVLEKASTQRLTDGF